MGIQALRKTLVEGIVPDADQAGRQVENVTVLVEDFMTRLHQIRRPRLTPSVLVDALLEPHLVVLRSNLGGSGLCILVMDKPSLVPKEKAAEQAARRAAYAAGGGRFYAEGSVFVPGGIQQPGLEPEPIDMTMLMARPYTRALIGPAVIDHLERNCTHMPRGTVVADLSDGGPPLVFVTGQTGGRVGPAELVLGPVADVRGGEGDIIADYWLHWAALVRPAQPRCLITTDADNLLLCLMHLWDAPAGCGDTYWVYSTTGRVSVSRLVRGLKAAQYTREAVLLACSLMGNDYVPKKAASGGVGPETIMENARLVCAPDMNVTLDDHESILRALTYFHAVCFYPGIIVPDRLKQVDMSRLHDIVRYNPRPRGMSMRPMTTMSNSEQAAFIGRLKWLYAYWRPKHDLAMAADYSEHLSSSSPASSQQPEPQDATSAGASHCS